MAEQRETEANRLRLRSEKSEETVKLQLDYAQRSLLTTQLLRVALLSERDPGQGLELLNDTKACPVAQRDFAWGWYHGRCKRERFNLRGHRQNISAVAITPDGKTMVFSYAQRIADLYLVDGLR